MLASLKVLLDSVVDYAGLFPPAKLTMAEAIANYAKHMSDRYNWMLGRFILPASRVLEFEEILAKLALTDEKAQRWSLSIILSQDWQLELEQVKLLQERGRIAIASLEFPPLPPTEIEKILPHLPNSVEAFCEIPFNADLPAYLTILKNSPIAAKIRTGGITPEAFPSTNQLSKYIFAFADAQLPFKATAGLHHLLPGKYRLTYEADSQLATMHGFLNVILLAGFIYTQKITQQQALSLLQEISINFFQIQPDSITWQQQQLSILDIEKSRQFFRSFGSCSFQEPIADITHIGRQDGY
ncbi:hypothetical protein Cri9333_2155 [Crinalium epipsammum PCC 9333]|uniref:Uncharacterized protein n=1 Tax=Crinalium epipsammum PCC 9333 TaxID=1173022 RepID=K9W0V8_9CYAN|nr:hypothetical protein [Crinalium epipsammum]AFZ13030.1 hypothetical protein Cri9333_2155 [Crinalium epipsammum PCC 9333]